MRLRTLVGSRAGQIEDYSFEAGRHALAAGFAAKVEEETPSVSGPMATPIAVEPLTEKTGTQQKRSGRRPRS